MTIGDAGPDPALGAPAADRERWPVVYRPTAAWTTGWRVLAVLLGVAAVALLAARLVRGPHGWEIPALVVYAATAVVSAVTMWRASAWPRLRRGDARRLNPSFGPLREENLTNRMRREIRRPGPLAPELRRPAAAQVAVYRLGAVWATAAVGLLVLGALAFRPPGDPADLIGGAMSMFCIALFLLPHLKEARTVRAAIAAGAVPRVAPAHERTAPSGRG